MDSVDWVDWVDDPGSGGGSGVGVGVREGFIENWTLRNGYWSFGGGAEGGTTNSQQPTANVWRGGQDRALKTKNFSTPWGL